MLDMASGIPYLDGMTYYRKSHPPIYYKIRTVVRCAFWGSVGAGAILTASWISQIGDKPECPITLNSDFTYTTLEAFDPATCWAGDHVELLDKYRWGWANPDL